jgi:hypothetical protein
MISGTNYSIQRPLLYYQPPKGGKPERVTIQFSRRTFSEIRPKPWPINLSDAQIEALDTLQFLSRRYAIPIQIEKGDMQFINNLCILHGRLPYEDDSTHW